MFPNLPYFVCVRCCDGNNEWFDFDTASSVSREASLSFARWAESKSDLPVSYFQSNPVIRVDRIVITVLAKGA